jgi:hypothetical protein
MPLPTTTHARPARALRPTTPAPDHGKGRPDQQPPRPDHEQDQDPFAHRPSDDEQGKPTQSKLFIPSYANDFGDRSGPWPTSAVSYKSTGLKIERPDGTPYLGGTIPRNGISTVRVVVANTGTATADAQVKLYWADPSAGFGPPHLKRGPLVGAPPPSVNVAPGATEITEPVTLTPQPDTPDHFCLIAVVEAFGDQPSNNWSPLSDRHYAQHNVDVVHVQAGGVGMFQFNVINPFATDAEVMLQLRSATAEELRFLSMTYGAEAHEVGEGALRMIAHADEQGGRPERMLRLQLRPGERRLCQGLMSTQGLRPGQIAAAEVQTSARPLRGERESERRGSYGVIFFVER